MLREELLQKLIALPSILPPILVLATFAAAHMIGYPDLGVDLYCASHLDSRSSSPFHCESWRARYSFDLNGPSGDSLPTRLTLGAGQFLWHSLWVSSVHDTNTAGH